MVIHLFMPAPGTSSLSLYLHHVYLLGKALTISALSAGTVLHHTNQLTTGRIDVIPSGCPDHRDVARLHKYSLEGIHISVFGLLIP
jgi:hypothetical protein